MDLETRLRDFRRRLEPWQVPEICQVEVFIEEHHGAPFGIELIDSFLERHGYTDINPTAWGEFNRQSALQYLEKTLKYFWGLRNSPECISIPRDFVETFSSNARFVTAGWIFPVDEYPVVAGKREIEMRFPFWTKPVHQVSLESWNPITSWPLDMGIVAVDEKLIGMLWMAIDDA